MIKVIDPKDFEEVIKTLRGTLGEVLAAEPDTVKARCFTYEEGGPPRFETWVKDESGIVILSLAFYPAGQAEGVRS